MGFIYHFTNLHKALTIMERYQLLEKECAVEGILDVKSLQFWREDMSILSEEEFEAMLQVHHFNKKIFSKAVTYEPVPGLRNLYDHYAHNSEWFHLLMEIVQYGEKDLFHSCKQDFTYILRPFIGYTSEKLAVICSRVGGMASSELPLQLTEMYKQTILDISRKTFVYELQKVKSVNGLHGKDPSERYISFLSLFEQPTAIWKLLNKYMVLTRLLVTVTQHYLMNIEQLLQRIQLKKESIRQMSGDIQEIKIESIELQLGDTHHGGKSVGQITLTTGNKFIYKPKFSNSDHLLEEVITFLKKVDPSCRIKWARTMIENDYFFQEYIHYEECSTEELQQFYTTTGQLLAILYIFNSTDVHMENIISQKNGPCLIDSESIFQQPVHFTRDMRQNLINEDLFLNITSVGYLPDVISGNQSEIDVSALTGGETTYPKKIWKLMNDRTDEIKYSEQYQVVKGANNLPGLSHNVQHYLPYILSGFKQIHQIITKYKTVIMEEILEKATKDLTVRLIFRHSQFYHELLNHSLHPDLLKDMLDREKIIENLWSYDIAYQDVIASEQEQLRFHDIPIFYNSVKTNTLHDHKGNEITDNLHYHSIKLIQAKIIRLSEEDLEQQVELISLAVNQEEFQTKNIDITIASLSSHSHTYDYLQEAKEIARNIMKQGLKSEDRNMTWIQYTNDLQNILQPINMSFYNGLSGLILFFVKLYEVTGEQEFFEYACEVAESISLEEHQDKGISSNVYGLLFTKSYLRADYHFINRKVKELNLDERTPLELGNEENLDYLNGLLGYTSMLIRFYQKSKDQLILKEAIKHADYILTKFDSALIKRKGFGHGAVSYALMFYRLWLHTNNKRYLRFSNTVYKKIRFKPSSSTTWCNGEIGTYMGYISKLSEKERMRSRWLNQWQDFHLLNNDCLCHGNAGLMDFNLLLYEKTGLDVYMQKARKLGDFVIKSKREKGIYQLNDIAGYRSVGLFTGAAGVGYQLLRLVNIQEVPSVLTG